MKRKLIKTKSLCAPRKIASHKTTPGKSHRKYILYYCSSFAFVSEISERIRNSIQEALIAKGGLTEKYFFATISQHNIWRKKPQKV